MLESKFQSGLIREIREFVLPGSMVLKNDSGYLQGVPDLLILFEDRWGMLEVKKDRFAKRQPNQQYYVDLFDRMSFAAVIFPENKEEILHALQLALGAHRAPRISQR